MAQDDPPQSREVKTIPSIGMVMVDQSFLLSSGMGKQDVLTTMGKPVKNEFEAALKNGATAALAMITINILPAFLMREKL